MAPVERKNEKKEPRIQISAPQHDGSFDQTLSSRSRWGKEIRLNHAKNVTGRFWCGLAILSASAFRTVQANSRDACVNARDMNYMADFSYLWISPCLQSHLGLLLLNKVFEIGNLRAQTSDTLFDPLSYVPCSMQHKGNNTADRTASCSQSGGRLSGGGATRTIPPSSFLTHQRSSDSSAHNSKVSTDGDTGNVTVSLAGDSQKTKIRQSREHDWIHFFSRGFFGSSEQGRDQSSFMSLSVYRASKSKMCLISEAVKARLGKDQVSLMHPILPEQPLLTGY
ncbi:unnamed protein product [Pleuronectes platessa]|uniref:Uncharacterized protein n=1 Tax=Pleuronectes platessa TaxID=8262 RepID=A0A9N7V7L1_PLEPL|nr:unnamed protein product [Pleuronectes platessa]